jgi:hypothetical protein
MDEERPREADPVRTGEEAAADAEEPASVDLDGEDRVVADDRPPRPPIEPESVDPEHAAFVLAGVALTVAVIVGVV